MATGSVEFSLTSANVIAYDAGSGSNVPAYACDGNAATCYESYDSSDNNAWVGIDLGSGNSAQLTNVWLIPREDTSQEINYRSGLIEGGNTTGGSWYTLYTLPSISPFFDKSIPLWNAYSFSASGTAYRMFRLRNQASAGTSVAEIRFAGPVSSIGGSPTIRPCRPVLSPACGNIAHGTTITITSATTSASIYYTTDGSTPTTSSTLYTGAITLTDSYSLSQQQVKAIAYDSSCGVTTSDIVVGYFSCPQQYVPDTGVSAYPSSSHTPALMWDTNGHTIQAHGGGILYDTPSSTYYWYGMPMDSATNETQYGVYCYSSTDLYTWTFQGQVCPPLPTSSPWTNYPIIERPHVLYNANYSNSAHKYVLWAHLDQGGYGNGHAGVAYSSSPTGPFTWYSAYLVNGYTSNDCTLFLDGTNAYFVSSTNNNASMTAAQLDGTNDWLSFDGTYISVGVTGGAREAPAVVKVSSTYYLITSGLSYYGAGNTGLSYQAASSLSGLSSATLTQLWTQTPPSNSTAYNSQSTCIFNINGTSDYMLMTDWWDSGESPTNLTHSGYAWYPIRSGYFSSGAVTTPPLYIWTLNNTWPDASVPAWTHIQNNGAQCGGSGASSLATTLSGAVTAGDLIVCWVANYEHTCTSVTDNQSNTFSQIYNSSPGNNDIGLWILQAPASYSAGSYTVTASGPGNFYPAMTVDEWTCTGSGWLYQVDGIPLSADGTSNAPGAGSLAAASNDLALIGLLTNATATVTAPSGFNKRTTLNYSSGSFGICSMDAEPETGSISTTGGLSASIVWTMTAQCIQAIGGLANSLGSGSITLGSLVASGSATASAPVTDLASGAITLGPLTVSGAGGFSAPASGSVTLGSLVVAGAGTTKDTASGAVTLGSLAVAGAGTTKDAASGSITLGSIVAAGTGSYTAPGGSSGSGSITLGSLTPAGAGSFTTTASGSVALAALVVSGSATAGSAGNTSASGAITLGSLVVASGAGFGTVAAGAITLGSLVITFTGSGGAITPQTFRQALYAKLTSIPELTALVGSAIYASKVPETHDIGRDGPAVCFLVKKYPRNHVLTGSDGTATSTVEIATWSNSKQQSSAIALAIWNAIDGPPINPWGTGYIQIMSVLQKDEKHVATPPSGARDQWVYGFLQDYEIRHWTAIPTLT